MGKRIHTYGEL